jgi:hypothetical protein
MLGAGESITPIPVCVTSSRFGHGRPKKKSKFSEEEVHGQREA